MKVEVAYARPDVQVILEVDVAEGATAEEAIRASGILDRFPEIDLTQQKVGIFGKVAPLSKALSEWDRVEIYRALIADPKAARRKRAQKGKKGKAQEARAKEARTEEAGASDAGKPARGAGSAGTVRLDADDQPGRASGTKKPAE